MNIDKNQIKALYRKFSRRPATLDGRRLDLLADYIIEERGLELDDECLVFSHMGPESPFRRIKLDHINGVAELGRNLAIVMHSSIIFFNKTTLEAWVHIKEPGFFERLLRR